VLCHGTFLVMKSGSGWIDPTEEIAHPCCSWNEGDVYLSAKDVRKGTKLQPGDAVQFFLYVDEKGLGAEDCTHVGQPTHNFYSPPRTPFGITRTPFGTKTPSKSIHTPSNLVVNLSNFYQDDDDSDDSEDEDTPTRGTAICLADILQPSKPPSVGSALHAKGTCKRCSFFPKNKCTNGANCEFCHYAHEKKPKRHKRKSKKAQVQIGGEENSCGLLIGEPMKINPNAFSQDFKDLLSSTVGLSAGDSTPSTTDKRGDSTPETIADDASADLLDLATNWDSPPHNEKEPGCIGGKFLAPPGLTPPPPSTPPPAPPAAVKCA